MDNLKICECGRYNSQTAEFCTECSEVLGESRTPSPRNSVTSKLFRWTGTISGLVLMGLTGGFVWGITGLPSVGLLLFIAGAAIWFGICQAFRNNSPSTMRVLRWLFPYDSWSQPDQ
jgi:hypothetical protein